MTFIPERIHQLHAGPMMGLDIDENFIASGGADGAVRVLSISGKHVGKSTAHTDIVNSVALDSKGMVASGSRDRTVRVYDPSIGRSYVVGDHDHWVMSVTWSDDGTRLASGSEDGTVGIWEPNGSSVRRIDLGYPTNSVDWRGDVIAVANGDRKLYLLDGDGALRRTVPGADQLLWSVALSPDARRVAWTGRDRRLRIVDVAAGDPIVVPAHTAQVWSVAWDESGERLATASADGTAAVWTPLGEAVERVTAPAWVRRALFRGVELYLATEEGELRILSADGLVANPPPPIEIPAAPDSCSHWNPQFEEAGRRPRCEECGSPEETRLCVTCGHIGCCESQLAHGTKHWLETGHPNTVPAAPGPYEWKWCYDDDMYVKAISSQ